MKLPFNALLHFQMWCAEASNLLISPINAKSQRFLARNSCYRAVEGRMVSKTKKLRSEISINEGQVQTKIKFRRSDFAYL